MLALGYEPEPRAEEVKEAGLPLLTAQKELKTEKLKKLPNLNFFLKN